MLTIRRVIFGTIFLLLVFDESSRHLAGRAYSVVTIRLILSSLSFLTGAYDQLDRLRDRFSANEPEDDSFHFIVVGGGSAGSVVASRLSENHRVLLLEAGGEPNPLQQIPMLSILMLNRPGIDWNYYTKPQKDSCLAMNNNQCSWPRAKGLGGCSNHNFLIYMRGHPNDYNNWANITGDPRWRYENVLPFFKKSEDYSGRWSSDRYHSVRGPLKVTESSYKGAATDFVKAGEDIGLKHTDINAEFVEAVGIHDTTEHGGRRFSTYDAYIAPARKRKNLTILKFAHVTKVLLEGPENHAVGVEYLRHGVRKVARATKEVIISAGSINSPQILMLSGIGPKEHLESHGIPVRVDLPVGKNLQDHISALTGPWLVDAPISIRIEREISLTNFTRFLLGQSGTAVSSSTALATSYMVSKVAKEERGQADWPDIQHILVGISVIDYLAEVFSHTLNTRLEVLQAFFKGLEDRDSIQVLNIISRPFSRGRVTLQGTDPLLPPLIDPNYFSDPRDMKVAVEGAQRLRTMLEDTPTFKAMNGSLSPIPFPGCEHLEIKSDAYWECYHRQYSFTVYHPVGTCAMGKRDSKDAVVDSELRVIGTKGLRVIDASIMPVLTTGNTNAPTIMIGEMGAEFVKNAWDSSQEGDRFSVKEVKQFSSEEGWGQCDEKKSSFHDLLEQEYK